MFTEEVITAVPFLLLEMTWLFRKVPRGMNLKVFMGLQARFIPKPCSNKHNHHGSKEKDMLQGKAQALLARLIRNVQSYNKTPTGRGM